ncbi:MAG: aminotransferase class III-fold pyridoxal phosphate-dependent enzyme [Nannocystaceae bacterium]|nr:aminotransferase class III-fold pyridoxal phosphate-dependent enzyme [Nannocystaceae bacterium]
MDRDISKLTAQYTYGTWRYQKGWAPLHVTRAENCHFWDVKGKRYLDLSSQLVCTNLGHQNQAVADAICKQAQSMAFIGPAFACDVRADLSEALLEVMPKGIDKFFFATSGTEANETAIRIARLYTGRSKVIARYTSYHGSTAGSMAATGDWRRWATEPAGVMPWVLHGPETNCYRCPLGRSYPECGTACADYLGYMIDHENDIAAVIVEPVVGTNGVLVPPPEYLPRLAEHCRRRGVLLIADEVMTGWGRTGQWFAVDHWGVVPDILVTAKGITNAMAPLGVCATSRTIAEHFDDHFFACGHTYEAHPLTLAPAVAAIEEYKRLGLIERARTVGETLGQRLRELAAKHPCVGEVRGLGMFWALELVRDRTTREPFATPMDKVARKPMVIDAVTAKLMELGVFCMGWVSHLVIAPPLTIDEAGIDEAIAALDQALALADAKVA